MRKLELLVVCLALLAPLPVRGEVQIVVQADGTRTITNESSGGVASRVMVKRPPPAQLHGMIQRHADATSLDPKLIEAVIQVESGYNPRAVSRKGAVGLMQLMPQTARELGVLDPFDPDQNVRGGARYLREMIDSFGSLDLALAAYNAGPSAVQRHRGVPPYRETRDYVGKVLGLLNGGGRFAGGTLEVLSFTPSMSRTAPIVTVPQSMRARQPREAPKPRPMIVRREASLAAAVAR